MNLNTLKKVFLLSSIVLFVIICVLDWSSLFIFSKENAWSFLPKYLLSLFCLAFVWFSAGESWNQTDSLITRVAFIFMLGGDTCLVFLPAFKIISYHSLFLIGVASFLIAHVILIFRFVRLWPRELRHTRKHQQKSGFLFFLALGITLFTIVFAEIYLLYPVVKNNPIVGGLIFYMTVLTLSSWLGVGTIFLRNHFPGWNARLIMTAMLFFFASDFVNGLFLAGAEGSFSRMAFQALIWTFYAPTLFFLAYSTTAREKHNLIDDNL